MTRFFVTGAHGFIGRAIVERLREQGGEVRGVDLLAGDDPAVVRGDVSLPGEWHAHASGCEVVIHTAALVGFYSSPRGYWEANVVAPRRVLDAAVAAGARRFVHLSSIVVFGFDFDGEVDERAPVRPNGVHYVDTKIASEQTVLAAHAAGEIDCTIVRPGDVYGPRSRPWTLEPIRLIEAGQAFLPGGGRGTLSPVYVDDLVHGIVRAAEAAAAPGRIFTLTGADHPAIGDFFAHYARMLGKRAPRAVPYRPARAAAAAIDTVAGVTSLRAPRARATASIAAAAARAGL